MTEKSVEKTQIEGLIKNDKVIIVNEDGIKDFYENSYIGTLEKTEKGKNILILDPIEVLLLYERRRILLWKNNNKKNDLYDFEGLFTYFIQYDKRLWHKYVIYMDLRKRGYIVRTGYGEGIDFRVFKRGADFENESAKFLIYPVFEGSPIELRNLDKMSRVAMSSRKELIIATVDRLSKVVYYNVKKFQIKNLDENIEGDAR
ncbi:MAG: tRNA-intron lyase [Promethearchaeota archaeon]